MTLAAGSRLGPYEIVAPIGAGGMGEVWRARDPRLGRDVAIKVLPASFSADADRLRRFEQEARAAGILNHPNITAVFDIGEHDGAPYVVQELLEGETLRHELGGGSLSRRQAIDSAIQIARGLAAAHDKGIVHRDLKPENVFVTKDGRLKILDFGLAKLTHMEEGGQTNLPTGTAGTEPGMVLGTIGYMSPEQVRGRPADARSDIFSFGAILYEMLAGQRAFRGDSAADTMSAILKEDPPELSGVQQNISPGLERIVRHCLEKNPEQRFQSARDLAFDLESLSTTSAPGTKPAEDAREAASRRGDRKWGALPVAGLLGLLAIAGILFFARRRDRPTRTLKVSLLAPQGTVSTGPIALSSDGTQVAFVSVGADGKRSLCVRPFDSIDPKILAGTEDAIDPFWAPDGRALGFFAARKLKRIDLAGGPPRDLADVSESRGGTWNQAGDIVFAPGPGSPLYRVSSTGGEATPVTRLDATRHETSHRWPSFLPDGRHFLYLDRSPSPSDRLRVEVGSIDGKEKTRLLEADTSAVYSAGKIFFARRTTLLAQTFDPASRRLSGEPAPVVEDVWRNLQTDGLTAFSASANGVLAYRRGGYAVNQLAWFDRDGRRLRTLGPTSSWASPVLSPNGERVAVEGTEIAQVIGSIYLIDASGSASRFTFGTWNDTSAVWSPDGNRIAFGSDRKGPFDLYMKDVSGTGDAILLLETPNWKYPESWSPDGRFLAYREVDPRTKGDLWILPLSGDRKPIPFLRTEADERNASFSPDGRFLAYGSDESGREEVYVQTFPASGSKWQISSGGGSSPLWRRDGKELFFLGADRRIMAVPIEVQGNHLSPGLPKPLFAVSGQQFLGEGRDLVVSADGQRFLFVVSPIDEIASPITLVMDVVQP